MFVLLVRIKCLPERSLKVEKICLKLYRTFNEDLTDTFNSNNDLRFSKLQQTKMRKTSAETGSTASFVFLLRKLPFRCQRVVNCYVIRMNYSLYDKRNIQNNIIFENIIDGPFSLYFIPDNLFHH